MSPKHKCEEMPKCEKSCCRQDQLTSVFLLKGPSPHEMEIVKLKHPGTEKPAYFAFLNSNMKLCELITFSNSYRSYFIDDTVKSNGNMYLMTAVDPLFLVLPYLVSSTGSRWCPLNQILRDDRFPDVERLSDNPRVTSNIHKISDKRGVDIVGYKYNEEKTLSWLETKVHRASDSLLHRQVHLSDSSSVVSYNFLKHSVSVQAESPQATGKYLRSGFGIVCEYLSAALMLKLQSQLDIPSEPERETPPASDADTTSKRSRSDTDTTVPDHSLSPRHRNKRTKTDTQPPRTSKKKSKRNNFEYEDGENSTCLPPLPHTVNIGQHV